MPNTYQSLTLQELMDLVESHYERNGYSDASPSTLTIGIMEEVGELAQQALLQFCPDYKARQGKELASIGCEIGDVIVYLLALCLELGIFPLFRDLETS